MHNGAGLQRGKHLGGISCISFGKVKCIAQRTERGKQRSCATSWCTGPSCLKGIQPFGYCFTQVRNSTHANTCRCIEGGYRIQGLNNGAWKPQPLTSACGSNATSEALCPPCIWNVVSPALYACVFSQLLPELTSMYMHPTARQVCLTTTTLHHSQRLCKGAWCAQRTGRRQVFRAKVASAMTQPAGRPWSKKDPAQSDMINPATISPDELANEVV